MAIRYISQSVAQAIDKELMSEAGGFRLEQLVELAGLASATAFAKVFPSSSHPNVLVICGSGNNGLDGLVAARHLYQFGYKPTLLCPKVGKSEFYHSLRKQAQNCSLGQASDIHSALQETDAVLDAIFGFSFSGEVREPFKEVIDALKSTKKPICAIDMPSAWDVEAGNIHQSFTPEVLVSLTAPKLGAKGFKGRHFLGGRFIPEELKAKFALSLPTYPGTDQVVEISSMGAS